VGPSDSSEPVSVSRKRWTPTRLIGRAPLAWRLAALIAIPAAVIAVAVAVQLQDLRSNQADIEAYQLRLERAEGVSEALERLRAERDLTILLMTAPDGAVTDQGLDEAQRATDDAIREAGLSRRLPRWMSDRGDVNDDADAAWLDEGDDVFAEFPPVANLDEVREAAMMPGVDPLDVIDVYSVLGFDYYGYLLDWTHVDAAEGVVPASLVIAYQNVEAATEWSAQARAFGAVLLSEGERDPGIWGQLGQFLESERVFLEQAQGGSDFWLAERLDALLEDQMVLNEEEWLWMVEDAGPFGHFDLYDAWLAQTADRPGQLESTSDKSYQRLVWMAEDEARFARDDFVSIMTVVVVMAILVAVATWTVSRSISNPLRDLAVAARGAAVGRLSDVDVPASKDAIGEIGRAYDELNRYMHEVADSAAEIARGDLERGIEPRSSEDRLGTALQSMTRQLSAMVTESRQQSAELAETVGELQETVSRDALTGLASRSHFEQVLAEQVAESRSSGRGFGVLFIDLDGFKPVNDTIGHDAGDELLVEVGRRMTAAVREFDVVARLGGDEFTVLVPGADHVETLQQTAQHVVEAVSVPYEIAGHDERVGASVGLALYPEHGSTAEELLRASDQAMYEAKHSGGGEARAAGRSAA